MLPGSERRRLVGDRGLSGRVRGGGEAGTVLRTRWHCLLPHGGQECAWEPIAGRWRLELAAGVSITGEGAEGLCSGRRPGQELRRVRSEKSEATQRERHGAGSCVRAANGPERWPETDLRIWQPGGYAQACLGERPGERCAETAGCVRGSTGGAWRGAGLVGGL